MTKQIITLGKAAELCELSQSILSQSILRRLFDDGHIQGFRVPNSKHRRLYRDSLAEYLTANGIRVPTGLIEQEVNGG